MQTVDRTSVSVVDYVFADQEVRGLIMYMRAVAMHKETRLTFRFGRDCLDKTGGIHRDSTKCRLCTNNIRLPAVENGRTVCNRCNTDLRINSPGDAGFGRCKDLPRLANFKKHKAHFFWVGPIRGYDTSVMEKVW